MISWAELVPPAARLPPQCRHATASTPPPLRSFVGSGDLVTLRTIRFETESSAGYSDGESGSNAHLPAWAVRAGPQRTIYFDPERVTAAIVTCGGLCPGLNDVIQSIVGTLCEYGVPQEQIFGIRYGLKGFYAKHKKPVIMSNAFVDGVHLKGGTILGTSRGGADIEKIVHRIDLWGLDMVFVIGGNGAAPVDRGQHLGSLGHAKARRNRPRDRVCQALIAAVCRWQRGRQCDRRLLPQAARAVRRDWRAQEHRQRHPAHRPLLRLRDRCG